MTSDPLSHLQLLRDTLTPPHKSSVVWENPVNPSVLKGGVAELLSRPRFFTDPGSRKAGEQSFLPTSSYPGCTGASTGGIRRTKRRVERQKETRKTKRPGHQQLSGQQKPLKTMRAAETGRAGPVAERPANQRDRMGLCHNGKYLFVCLSFNAPHRPDPPWKRPSHTCFHADSCQSRLPLDKW